MKLIKVPKVSATAYNPKRPASDLLRRQVAQLHHVVDTVRGYGVLPSTVTKVKTEGQAATFIAAATRALHPDAPVASAAAAPPRPVATGPAKAKRRAPRTKTRRRR